MTQFLDYRRMIPFWVARMTEPLNIQTTYLGTYYCTNSLRAIWVIGSKSNE